MKNDNDFLKTIARLAPSPTGKLHLGNAWSFLIAWLACRLENGNIYLRMEDIDPQRAKPQHTNDIIEDLTWLGIDWDSFETQDIVYQSQRYALYEKNLQSIAPLVYPCFCTRKELRDLAGAPQKSASKNTKTHRYMPDTGSPYHGKCRNLSNIASPPQKNSQNFCLRLACPPFSNNEIDTIKEKHSIFPKIENNKETYTFTDLVHAEQKFTLNDIGGDFGLRRSDGVWAYQLAVVSDDIAMQVSQIVRGDDILTSTPRQLYLYDLLDSPAPVFAHIPLLLDSNKDRLAKRHESLSLKSIREKNQSPEKVITYLASLMGFTKKFSNAQELLTYLKEKSYTKFPWENLKKYKNGIITHEKFL